MSVRDEDLMSDAELRAFFAPHQTDPASFLAGVQRRLDDHGKAAPRVTRASWLRQVASLLPWDPTNWLSIKNVVAALSMPVVMLACTFGVFGLSVRGLYADPEVKPAGRTLRRFVRLARVVLPQGSPMVAVLAFGLVGYAGYLGRDVLLPVLTASMAGLVMTLRLAERFERLSRDLVLGIVQLALLVAIFALIGGRFVAAAQLSDEAGTAWALQVMYVALVVCVLLRLAGSAPLVEKCVAVFLVISLAPVVAAPVRGRLPTVADMREEIARAPAAITDLIGWEEGAAACAWLRAAGEELPDLSAHRLLIEHTIDSGVSAHPAIWTGAATMGLIDAPHWRTLYGRHSERHAVGGWLAQSGPLRVSDYDLYRLPMLEAARPLSTRERAHLVSRIEAAWPEPGSQFELRTTVASIRALDALGAGDRVAARRASVHAILARHWIAPTLARFPEWRGAFAVDPGPGMVGDGRSTAIGVTLLARLGVPTGIDIREVRAYLARQARITVGHCPSPFLRLRIRECAVRC